MRSAAQVIRHPGYNSQTQDWDLAMVKLSSPVSNSDCVGTVALPSSDVSGGEKCWISGWGTLRSGGSQPDVLMEAPVNIISNRDCTSKYGYSSSKITDACQGDSGGPLVCQGSSGSWTLYGATSWGYGCAGKTYPGIWARVYDGVSWINSVMSGGSSGGSTRRRRRR